MVEPVSFDRILLIQRSPGTSDGVTGTDDKESFKKVHNPDQYFAYCSILKRKPEEAKKFVRIYLVFHNNFPIKHVFSLIRLVTSKKTFMKMT